MSITEIVCDPTPPTIDFAAIKKRQQATWATGDFAVVGTTLQIVGESLCEAVDLRAGERVLDVAAGNASPAAARRFASVTALDYVPEIDVFRRHYGPVNKAYEAVGPAGAAALTRDLVALLERHNRGGEALVAPAEYLEVVIERPWAWRG